VCSSALKNLADVQNSELAESAFYTPNFAELSAKSAEFSGNQVELQIQTCSNPPNLAEFVNPDAHIVVV
jgi:hypothetical protein